LPTTDISEPLHGVSESEILSAKGAFAYLCLVLKMAVVIYLGLRPDYIFIRGYLRHHALYYFSWVATIIVAEVILNNLLDWKVLLGSDWLPGTILLLATSTFYYAGLPFWFVVAKEPLTRRLGKAKLIMISEVLFSIMWFTNAAGFRAFCQSVRLVAFPEAIPDVASTRVGLVLVLIGFFFKVWACSLTGFNSYFWRDMVTNIPNSHFVESSLYSLFSHPTYTVGYIQALGYAVVYRSVEGCIAYLCFQVSILMFVYFVEAPFIDHTYNQTSTGKSSVVQR